MDEIQLELRGDKGHTKEQVLEAVRVYQDATLEMHTTTNEFKDALDFGHKVRVEQLKRNDIVFEKTGIEEEDIENSIDTLGLAEDPDYKAIIDEGKVKQQAFLAKLEQERVQKQVEAAAKLEAAKKESNKEEEKTEEKVEPKEEAKQEA